MTCRICLDDGGITPCDCSGTHAYVHEKCLLKWIHTSGNKHCEICQRKFVFKNTLACRPRLYCLEVITLRQSPENRIDALILSSALLNVLLLFVCIPIPFTLQLVLLVNIANVIGTLFLRFFTKLWIWSTIYLFAWSNNIFFAAAYLINTQRRKSMNQPLLLQLAIFGIISILRFIELAFITCKTKKVISQEKQGLLYQSGSAICR